MPRISPLAAVEETAILADDVTVGAFSYVGGDVTLAAGCVVENNVSVVGKTTLGERNHVFPMAVIGAADGAGQKTGRVIIGEANTIREHATIYSCDGAETVIGKDNLIMIGCVIGAGAKIANHGIFDNRSHIGPDARVDDYVRMSGFATVCAKVLVGPYTFITGYTSVDSDAPPFARVQGSPMRVRGVNTPNLKRCGFGDDDVRAIKSAFRELFNGSDARDVATVARRLSEDSNPHVRRLAQFVLTDADEGMSQ